MKVTPQNFPKNVIVAFPSGDAASETIETFRKNSPDGYSYTTPKGPRILRLKPLRGGETNKQLAVMGENPSEVESVVKTVPQLAGRKVDSSFGNGFISIVNESTGDALKLYSVQKPSTVFRAAACDRLRLGDGAVEPLAAMLQSLAPPWRRGRFDVAKSYLGECGASTSIPFLPKEPISIATWNARGLFASAASVTDRSCTRWRPVSALLRRGHI
eukprot:548694-Pyramimonas_sp.AAC.1